MAILSTVKIGKRVRIKDISKLYSKDILVGFGVLPNDEIEVIRRAPLGSPIFFRDSRGGLFALRKSEAALIEVEEESK